MAPPAIGPRQSRLTAAEVQRLVDDTKQVVDSPQLDPATKLAHVRAAKATVSAWAGADASTRPDSAQTREDMAALAARAEHAGLFSLERMERLLVDDGPLRDDALKALGQWRGADGAAVLLAEALVGSAGVTDAYVALKHALPSLDESFDVAAGAKGVLLLTFALAGDAAGIESVGFVAKHGPATEGARRWEHLPSAIVGLARALGTDASALAALDFGRTHAHSENDKGVNEPWPALAKSLVALAHVVGGDERAHAARGFVDGQTWAPMAKAVSMLAHVLDPARAEVGLQLAASAPVTKTSSRALLGVSHAISGPTRTAEALAALSTDPSLKQIAPHLDETKRQVLVLQEAFRKTPDAELPRDRKTLSLVVAALSAALEA